MRQRMYRTSIWFTATVTLYASQPSMLKHRHHKISLPESQADLLGQRTGQHTAHMSLLVSDTRRIVISCCCASFASFHALHRPAVYLKLPLLGVGSLLLSKAHDYSVTISSDKDIGQKSTTICVVASLYYKRVLHTWTTRKMIHVCKTSKIIHVMTEMFCRMKAYQRWQIFCCTRSSSLLFPWGSSSYLVLQPLVFVHGPADSPGI